jgi:hypothetical protein
MHSVSRFIVSEESLNHPPPGSVVDAHRDSANIQSRITVSGALNFACYLLPLANMSSEQPAFERCASAESIARYRRGGYHPIHIDDVLHNRYRIVNKLGHGTYSTIWLVEDLGTGRSAALKVLTADVSRNSSEVAILRHLKKQQLNYGGPKCQEFVIELLDDFKVEGPNGTHQCIVTEVLGLSLAEVIDEDLEDIYGELWFPIEISKVFAKQSMQGVAYLHSCGVIHGGKSSDAYY